MSGIRESPVLTAFDATEPFWRQRLEGSSPLALQLQPAPAANDAGPGRVCLRIDEDARSDAGSDLSIEVLAALFAVLHRYVGESDLTLGIADAEGRLLPLRIDLADGPGFAALSRRVADRRIEVLDQAGIEAPGASLDGRAFEVGLIADHGLRPCPGKPDSTSPYAELSLALQRDEKGWQLDCGFSVARHSAVAIGRLLGHLQRLLDAGRADGLTPIGRLPMLDAAERQVLIAEGNQTASTYPDQSTVIDLFRRQVLRRPQAWAVIDGRTSLHYRALEQAVDSLAARLRRQGIGPGSLVAVCLERTVELPMALLAVLASGAAYLPMDPRYPPARLRQMLDNAEPALLLSQAKLRDLLPERAARLLLIDGLDDDERPLSPATSIVSRPDDLAYLIYTSGSTGQPKGVQIHHRALCNLLWSLRGELGFGHRDRLLAVSTVSFDIAALELFLPLICGAAVVIAADADIVDGAALRALLAAQRITVMQATPVSWQLLLKAGWQAAPGFRMLCGGEALPRPLAQRLLAGGGALWNLYGPTETTIWSSLLRVESGSGPLAIGPPIANTRFHVLDSDGELLPAGQAGELYIGGDGVGQGYRQLPVLTARHFVADRFDPAAGGRLYRTGDRVRRRPDGCFDFLGRIDKQIKLRGYRIEPGDLEAVLLAQPGIDECVAVVGADGQGEPALLAYVAVHAEAQAWFDVAALRAALRQQLPAYLCPAAIIVIDSLPRLANRKIDRARLPALVPERHSERSGGSPEQRLARHWRAVLGEPAAESEAIAPGSHFFEAGGHSLLAVQLLGRIEREFGVRLSMAALFEQPTFAGLMALLMTGVDRAYDFSRMVRMQVGGSGAPLIALNNTGIYYGLSRCLGEAQPFVSLQLFDPAQPMDQLPRQLADIASAYVALIRELQPDGPYHLVGWCVAGVLAHEVARQLLAAGEAVERLILIDTWAPDYLRRLPWWRARLAAYAFRWHLIAADWRRLQTGQHSWRQFLARRATVQSLRRLLQASPAERLPAGPELPGEREHDQWLLQHLEAAADAFAPGLVAGRMLLFRSSEEPAGRFLDPQMGWGPHVAGDIAVTVIPGSHFGIFQAPAVVDMADAIRRYGDCHLRPEAPA